MLRKNERDREYLKKITGLDLEDFLKRLELFNRLDELERERLNLSPEELYEKLYRIGELALELGILNRALNAYMEINDRKKVRDIGQKCLEEGWYFDAVRAFKFLGDKKGVMKIIRELETKDYGLDLEISMKEYLGERTIKSVNRGFKKWISEMGIESACLFDVIPTANMMYHVVDNDYDVGIGIAKGGLFLTYLSHLFELPVKIVHCHKKGRETEFNWVCEPNPQELRGKNVIVFDKDVITGRTVKRVLKEIKKYRPNRVDLALIYNPNEGIGPGARLSNVPKGYTEVYYPEKFSYREFDKVVERLEKSLKRFSLY